MQKPLDLVVVGTGVGGTAVAKRCRRAGWEVAIVDSRPYGGTCARRGCDPKRVLVEAAAIVDAARRLDHKGIAGDVHIAWDELIRFKRTFTLPVPSERETMFREAGIHTLHGRARFVGPTRLRIDETTLEARHVLLASGAEPAVLGIEGEQLLTSSDELLDADALPPRVGFLGGGYIAFELAHVAAIAGAQVTMIEQREQPLDAFDPDLVAELAAHTRTLGVDIRLRHRVHGVERRGAELLVHTRSDDGPHTFAVDMLVHAAGRVPAIGDLALEEGRIDHDRSGVLVDEYLASTSNPAVYAVGDVVAGAPALTPVASFQAEVAAANLIHGRHRRADYPPIPSVVFTSPPLARIGMQEREAIEAGLQFQVRFERTSSWFSARRVNQAAAAHKILIEDGTQRILGAHLLGPRADELINAFAMAMRWEVSARELVHGLFAYPTAASDIGSMLA